MRILSIDYGTKRIGLAISDTEEIAAHPFKTLENKGFDDFSTTLKRILVQEDVKEVVMGKPLTMRGKESDFTREVSMIASKLSRTLGTEVHLIDERLTSMMSGKVPDKKAREKVDTRSAQLILETYLAHKHRSGFIK